MSNATFEKANWAQSFDAVNPANGRTQVMFKTEQIKDKFQSERQKRVVMKEIVKAVFITADAQYNRPEIVVTEEIKEKYAREWAEWERSRETKVLGMPIEMAHFMTDTQKAEFRAAHVTTIEQLASLPDSFGGGKIMGFNDLRKKAQVFVDSGRDAEMVAKIREEANAEVTAMRKELDEMKAAMAEMKTKKPKAE